MCSPQSRSARWSHALIRFALRMREGGWSHFCHLLRLSFGSRARSKEFFEDTIRGDAGESRKSASGRSSQLDSWASFQAQKKAYASHCHGSGLEGPSGSGPSFCRESLRFSGL